MISMGGGGCGPKPPPCGGGGGGDDPSRNATGQGRCEDDHLLVVGEGLLLKGKTAKQRGALVMRAIKTHYVN
jgi:hypothetical protein